jgi:hypothetical protein
MTLTAEELAIYGLIDAETYIRLTEALMAGVAARQCLPRWDRRTAKRIRTRAQEIWRRR